MVGLEAADSLPDHADADHEQQDGHDDGVLLAQPGSQSVEWLAEPGGCNEVADDGDQYGRRRDDGEYRDDEDGFAEGELGRAAA